MKNKYLISSIGIMSLIILIIVLVMINKGIEFREYKNDYFKVKYDSTWKIVKDDNFKIIHEKSKSILEINYKILDDNYYDTNLKDIVNDIIYEIEKQNNEFKLISTYNNINDKYDSVSYLYEDGKEQALVNIYKKDNVLVIMYYNSLNEYYDIVMDSASVVIDSLEIFSGEK